MSKVGIITDSIHGLSPELIQQYDIRVAPMGVVIDNKAYRDTLDITSSQFYPLFKEARTPCSTTAAVPGDFLSIYRDLAGVTDSMIYIGVSKAVTATYSVAQQTREIFQEERPEVKIELIDSKTGMGALGFLVLEAARAAEKGKSLPEIIDLIQNLMLRVKYLSVLDTIRYLVKIGRVPKSAVTEEKLRYRPMIGFVNGSGQVENFSPVDIDNALDKLIQQAEKYIEPGKPVHAIIHHSEYIDEAEALKEKIISRFNPVELYVTEYSPAALASTGLMTGLSFYS